MRILVTGGTGFVGSRLVATLCQQGHTVHALSRSKARAAVVLPDAVEIFEWNSDKGPPPAESLAGVEGVVNLMGEPIATRWNAAAKARIRASRAGATSHLVAALPDSVKVFVCASAIGYYPSDPERIYDEAYVRTEPTPQSDSAAEPDFPGEVVLDWEAAAERAGSKSRRVVTLRIGLVVGPNGGLLGKMLTPFRLGLGGPLGDGRMWSSWIHIDDVIGLVGLALNNKDANGPLNATAPNPVRFKELTSTLGSVLHRPAFLPVPSFAVRLAFGEAAGMILASQRVVPTRALELGYKFRFNELRRALEDVVRS